jgi:hypothetical protein
VRIFDHSLEVHLLTKVPLSSRSHCPLRESCLPINMDVETTTLNPGITDLD